MANLIHKLAKKAPPFSTRLLLRPSPTLISHQSSFTSPNLRENPINPSPFSLLNPIVDVNSLNQTQHIYPNSPFGYLLNPVSSTGFGRLGLVEDEDERGDADVGIVRADSVKKKRKKKMNKHKYKKLRKRLRRKSRS